jgi:nucleoside 2-deoxyribosyltransferase
MKKLYFGCALNHAPAHYRRQIEDFRSLLEKDFTVLRFKGLQNGTPEEIFKHDIEAVTNCDFLVADCSYPSLGLGFELGYAVEKRKPIIVLAKQESLVSPLILGIRNVKNDFAVFRYRNIKEALAEIKKFSSNFLNSGK